MNKFSERERKLFEIFLIIVSLGLTFLVHRMTGNKMVVLNLFFLPVVLSGFFLGRYHAGVLALLCVISASMVTALDLDQFATIDSPLATGLSVTLWGAVLCLTAILVGTLSDERSAQADDLHDAYVGVIEVLSSYLQGGNPRLKALTSQVAEQSHRVATAMRLTPKQIDDIRVAALMHDIGRIEVTTKVITRAVDSLESRNSPNYSFQGTDLVHSLGTVLRGAIPILLNQDQPWPAALPEPQSQTEIPIGAKIVRAVRTYCSLTTAGVDGQRLTPREALAEMRRDRHAGYDSDVLEALSRIGAELQPA
ncbi:MAG TPA: HD domain-containing phosphohydrolase [Pirellulales bacterium]|jgi:HD-GYP domain-containing protein (c-di-GMP phosphodiesterase class II)|nr:HD domain-containing phosphohydrolase [Pirellulales bacterium]